MIETADSANPAHGDEMNVVQIRYGWVGPNTAWSDMNILPLTAW